jgi:hypothetical protein
MLAPGVEVGINSYENFATQFPAVPSYAGMVKRSKARCLARAQDSALVSFLVSNAIESRQHTCFVRFKGLRLVVSYHILFPLKLFLFQTHLRPE